MKKLTSPFAIGKFRVDQKARADWMCVARSLGEANAQTLRKLLVRHRPNMNITVKIAMKLNLL